MFQLPEKSYFKIYIFSSVLSCVWVEQQSKNKQKLQPGEINKKMQQEDHEKIQRREGKLDKYEAAEKRKRWKFIARVIRCN